jgi:hypothetical protein
MSIADWMSVTIPLEVGNMVERYIESGPSYDELCFCLSKTKGSSNIDARARFSMVLTREDNSQEYSDLLLYITEVRRGKNGTVSFVGCTERGGVYICNKYFEKNGSEIFPERKSKKGCD